MEESFCATPLYPFVLFKTVYSVSPSEALSAEKYLSLVYDVKQTYTISMHEDCCLHADEENATERIEI